MSSNGVLLIVELVIFGGLALLLHRASSRFGLSPLLIYIMGLTGLMQYISRAVITIHIGQLGFSLTGTIYVPVVLMTVLLLYIAEGTLTARMTLLGVLGVSVLAYVVLLSTRLHYFLPGSSSLTGLQPDSPYLRPSVRATISSILAFGADLAIIAVTYQAIKNRLPRLPGWIAPGIALLVALWTDAILFPALCCDLFGGVPVRTVGMDMLSKTLAGLVLWVPLAYYLGRIAPRLPNYRGDIYRPTLDMLFGNIGRMSLALQAAEAAREESEIIYQQLTDNIEAVFWLADPERRQYYYVSPAYETIWGHTQQSLYNNPRSYLTAIHPDDFIRVMSALPRQTQGKYDIEYRVIHPDGTIRWVRDRAFPIKDRTGQVYRLAGLAQDITDQKQLETQELALTLEQEKVNLLRNFISDASHDLKSPITAIKFKLGVLEKLKDPRQQDRHLADIHRQTDRLTNIIDSLLTLSRLESVGDMVLEPTDINIMLREIALATRPLAEARQQHFEMVLTPGLGTVNADKDELTRAVTNLVDNAIRYTPEDGVVSVTSTQNGSAIDVCVSDTGIGIEPDELPHIFDRFFRSLEAKQVNTDGTGLGLAIVKRIIERHHGTIDVTSTPGAGTSFTVTLPAKRGTASLHR